MPSKVRVLYNDGRNVHLGKGAIGTLIDMINQRFIVLPPEFKKMPRWQQAAWSYQTLGRPGVELRIIRERKGLRRSKSAFAAASTGWRPPRLNLRPTNAQTAVLHWGVRGVHWQYNLAYRALSLVHQELIHTAVRRGNKHVTLAADRVLTVDDYIEVLRPYRAQRRPAFIQGGLIGEEPPRRAARQTRIGQPIRVNLPYAGERIGVWS